MYNSQVSVEQLTKTWKVLIAVLSLTLCWQYLNTQVQAGLFTQKVQAQTIVQPNIKVPTQTPAQIQQQSFMARWKNAPFLAIVDTPEKVRYSKDDLFCMAKNIYHEAGNQSRLGKFAVAQVTLNRMKHPEFRNSVCGVVFEPYQFSWANNHRIRWTTPRENEMWEDSKEVAREALVEGARIKGMQDAIYYHATYVHPGWRGVDRLVRIGAHIFYTEA